ncbi:hypothetical protein [Clostridium coskatii]|uniref:Uncharacterized protein n=1 Tax=Clostridium coskatii TaxID=1705578 RepID=A0A170NL20_9CLOT|nr:hypothetical protein [Clostridium coskatii]OAA91311.1 hypothetical protein WX73_01721 [Clostridium coskatii]OBR93943.1 hypothetical protein CLCOS_20790 [Clostridium coskatii]
MENNVSVLKPQQLADRWQVSLTKIYEDNNAGLIPHLKTNRNRFPIAAIEAMENETGFDERDIPTPLERKQRRKIAELEKMLELKDEEIKKLRSNIVKACTFLTEEVYSDILNQDKK